MYKNNTNEMQVKDYNTLHISHLATWPSGYGDGLEIHWVIPAQVQTLQ